MEKAVTVADYTIAHGTTDWDGPLNANLTDINNRLTTVEGHSTGQTYYLLVASSTAPAAVKAKADYVCDGIADQVEIQTAVDAAFAQSGGIVQLSTGIFKTTFPITLHPTVTIEGTHGDQIFNASQLTANSYIAPQAGFTGGAAIILLGQTAGGYSNKSADSRIFNLTINGDSSPAGIHGIQSSDYVHGAVLRDVAIVRPTGKGIYTFTENGSQPFSWTLHRVLVDNAGDVGIHLINHTDCTMVDVISIGANTHGYQLSNMPNSRLIGCRAEWSEAHGYKLEGNFGTGQGSGGLIMSGCSTDRNGQNGIDITTTGNAPIVIDGLMTRRDGRNGGAGGGGYSGIFASAATTPIIITGWSQYPGVDDNGTGTNSPQVGGTFSNNTSVQMENAYIHAATTAVTQSGNTTFLQGASIIYATGTTAAPTRATQNIYVDVTGDTMTGALANTTGAGANAIYTARVTGDTNDRVQIRGDGRINWGPGNAATDTDLYRSAAGSLTTDGFFAMASGQASGQFTSFTGAAAAFICGTAGGGVQIKGGTNARIGTATLVGGTVTVNNTSVTANTRIILSRETTGGTTGNLSSTRVNGTSFTINSSNAADTSTIAWLLVEQG